jgi:hypothetical protein
MNFNRFDICEAWSCLAHDWGLYAVAARLDDMGFTPSPLQSTETLSENARAIYDANDGHFKEYWRQAEPNNRKPLTIRDRQED